MVATLSGHSEHFELFFNLGWLRIVYFYLKSLRLDYFIYLEWNLVDLVSILFIL